ncbi:MAG: site-2 protease family protein [Bdellovibrionales bacterium]|nr:site-2 protease family protein [Bdellovibrionales bacterium]
MEKLQYLLIWMVPFLFSLSVHECAHAWVANRNGDSTARLLGRMTINPTAHIDPFGTLLFPIMSFFTGFAFIGWAKPVPVNERNLRQPLRDGMFVAIAGPGSNFALALVFAGLIFLLGLLKLNIDFMRPIQMMLLIGVKLNILLGMFNLLPFPPLDGGRVLYGLVPALREPLDQISRYGFLVLILLLYSGILDMLLFRPANQMSQALIQMVT